MGGTAAHRPLGLAQRCAQQCPDILLQSSLTGLSPMGRVCSEATDESSRVPPSGSAAATAFPAKGSNIAEDEQHFKH